MIRSRLVQLLQETFPHIDADAVEQGVDVLLQEISEAMVRGDRVELRGFGAFTVRERGPRRARNPRTGEEVEVPATRAVHFRAGKELRARINGGIDPEG
jgi:integration host factor subunit beta